MQPSGFLPPVSQSVDSQEARLQFEAVAKKKGLNRYLIVSEEGKLEQTHFLKAWIEDLKGWVGRPNLRDRESIKFKALQLMVSLDKEWINTPSKIALIETLAQRSGLTNDPAFHLNQIIGAVAASHPQPIKDLKESPKIRDIKEHHARQLAQFEMWAKNQEWSKIHQAHYDWWMFPVDRPSRGHGDRFALSQEEIEVMKKDPDFMRDYRRGVVLVVKAWGWDLEKDQAIVNPQYSQGQKWNGYGVRLAKMSDSVRLFGEWGLHTKLKKFFKEHCLTQQSSAPISDLSWLKQTLF